LGLGRRLGIPIDILDCSAPFQDNVVDPFVDAYQKGLTPNPCIACNTAVKFGTVLDRARKLGATALATGHYARILRDESGRPHLHKGLDPEKEQSYFLAFLNRRQLEAARFPLGDRTKASVIRMARELGLRPAAPEESQDVCFIRDGDYRTFLARQPGVDHRPGPIQDLAGNTIGRHRGLHRFTVGQRRGINCPAAEPYYVVRLEPDRNRLVVGFRRDLFAGACTLAGTHWLEALAEAPLDVQAKIRYRSPAVDATLVPLGDRRAQLRFHRPQAAVTPGQAAVCYQGDRVLGGGWIAPADDGR
jgi:tRNA-specific 2-thiouridylase